MMVLLPIIYDDIMLTTILRINDDVLYPTVSLIDTICACRDKSERQ
jgi:hypothetical protein